MRHTSGPAHRPDASPYALPRAFYEAFLDPSLAFTCAYYPREEADLAEAQTAKFDHLARKLRLKPYQTLLDIDCGWGAFVIHASKRYGVTAHGITSSAERAEYAQEWIRREGLEDQALVEHRDYRELVGELQFDRISAIGGLEHVGLRHLAGYFNSLHRLLKDHGLFLSHGITRPRQGGSTEGSNWRDDRAFSGIEPPSLATLVTQLEDNGFEIQDMENLRRHYAKTCAQWVERLQENRQACLHHVDESVYRAWLLYLGMRSVYFEEGAVSLHQLLATKRQAGFPLLPLTREDIYA
jgi:cyclopropane-fatty-acyl-phospholipid synthase